MTSTPARGLRPRILVIDDDGRTPILVKGTGSLSDVNFDVEVARDIPAAHVSARKGAHQLAVFSVDLTGERAWRVAIERLRETGLTAPIILLSRGIALPVDLARGLGIRDHLRKPLLAPVLREALRSALAESRLQEQQPAEKPIAAPRPPSVDPFNVLYALGRSVNSSIDLEEVLHRVVEAAVLLTRAEQGSLMLLDGDSGVLTVRAAKNFDEDFVRTFRLKADDSIAGQVVRTGKPLLLGGAGETKIKTQFLVRSAVYVPIRVRDWVIGVLSVDNQRAPGTFTARDQQYLVAVADCAALALANHRLGRLAADQGQALAQAVKELDSFTERQDQMIQNLSHELRTPLIFIKGFADLAVNGDLGEVDPEIMQGMRTIQHKVNDLVRIIENAVALGQDEQASVRLENVALQPILHDALERLRPSAEKANVVIVADLPDEALWVKADRRRLGLAVHNLIDNAIKFSPNGGLVTLGAAPASPGQVEVVVSDTGVGIPADKLDRIFERFYQVDGSVTRRYGGVGLGLAAARQVIRAHGNDLSVESRPGEGSIFRFTLFTGELASPG